MGTTTERRARVDWVMSRLEMAKLKNIPIDRVKLVAQCALDTGCSERTASEILKMLQHAGQIKFNSENVWI